MLKKHRRNIGEASEKHRRNNEKTMEKQQGDSREDLSGTQKQILELLSKDTRLSAKKMAEIIGISSRNIEANIRKLKKFGILVRHGSPKNGYWEIV